MSNLTFNVTATGNPDDEDFAAAELVVEAYNEQRRAEDPPGEELPMGNPGQLAQSYQTVLGDIIAGAHLSYSQQAADKALASTVKEKWRNATKAQRAAAVAALG